MPVLIFEQGEIMKKHKLLTVALAGLALASCINEKNSGDEITSFTASPTIGGIDLRTITDWPGGLTGNIANIDGFNVTLSNGGTIAKFTCPAGMVSFIGRKTCNNTTGGCDYNQVFSIYSTTFWDGWGGESSNTQDTGETSLQFSLSNAQIGGGGYGSRLICIPQNQTSYWS